MLSPEISQKITRLLIQINPQINPSDFCFELIVSDDRDIYRISSSSTENFVFKTIGSGQKSKSEFVDEYRILMRFKELASQANQLIAIPYPIQLIDDIGILMTECPGKTLKLQYFRSLGNIFARANVTRAVQQSAQLLASIHGLSLRKDKYLDLLQNRQANLLRFVDVILQNPDEMIHEDLFKNAYTLFTFVNEKTDQIETCELHGNFALRNILWDGNKISTIDLEDSRTDTIYFDVALLIAELINKKIFPMSKRYNTQLINNFIQTYNSYHQLDLTLLSSYVLYHLIWSYYELATRKRSGNFLKRFIVKRRKQQLRQEIKRQLKMIETDMD